jgi:YhgE/Pip-like protein
VTTSGSDHEEAAAAPEMTARKLLRVPTVWVLPTVLVSVLIMVVTLIYFGSIVDPAAHLSGLPVLVVNQDQGADTPSGPVNLGAQTVSSFKHSSALTSRLTLQTTTLEEAHVLMDQGAAYAAVVFPTDFTQSTLELAGVSPTPSGSAPQPTVEVQTNPRAGTLGVNLATGVLQPALTQASEKIGKQVLALRAANGHADPTVRALLASPVRQEITPYRPLPDHAGLGLSAFYLSLLTIMTGFLGATIINSGVDSALGYATSEIGPWWRLRKPLSISRWQTLLAKWAMAAVVVPFASGVMLLAAAAILQVDAPNAWLLWLYVAFASVVVAIGTLALFAALGTLGQLFALIIFVYLALASSGGTVPLQALSGFYRFTSSFEPLRQILDGVRAILYFDAQGDAGLTRALVLTSIGLVFWLAVGTLAVRWYDRRGLDRMQPELMAYVNRAVRAYSDEHPGRSTTSR